MHMLLNILCSIVKWGDTVDNIEVDFVETDEKLPCLSVETFWCSTFCDVPEKFQCACCFESCCCLSAQN